MQVIYYTQETAPHLPVPELDNSNARSSKRWPHDFEKCDACKAHASDPSKPSCWRAVCAACNWSRTDVVKLRGAKRRAFEAQRNKPVKLSAPVEFSPLFPKGFNPRAVVLPRFTPSNPFLGIDRLSDGVAARYLEAVGVKRTAPNMRTWSCGCTTNHNENSVDKTCARHDAVFHGDPNKN
jgi:hypothetical protein